MEPKHFPFLPDLRRPRSPGLCLTISALLALLLTATSSLAANDDVISPSHSDVLIDDDFAPDANDWVYALATQPDGRILVGGRFQEIAGRSRPGLARLHPNGSLDLGFAPELLIGSASQTVAALPDGRVLAAGWHYIDGHADVFAIVRLLPNGKLDPDFNPPSIDGHINTLATLPNGQIMVGGMFNTIGGHARNSIARLHADGSVDTRFNFTGISSGHAIWSLALQANGRLLVGGWFDQVSGQHRGSLIRLFADGSLDTGFDPMVIGGVHSIAIQPDGRILIGGDFFKIANREDHRLARLHPNGTRDLSFDAGIRGDSQYYFTRARSLALQADGKVVVTGYFSRIGSHARRNLARLEADGRVDPFFRADIGNDIEIGVLGVTLQQDGRILVGGDFEQVLGKPRSMITRLMHRVETAEENLYLSGADVIWARKGIGPELSLPPQLEISRDGVNYQSLGAMKPVDGGWLWAFRGLCMDPPGGYLLRARGKVSSASSNSSHGLIENVLFHDFLPCS